MYVHNIMLLSRNLISLIQFQLTKAYVVKMSCLAFLCNYIPLLKIPHLVHWQCWLSIHSTAWYDLYIGSYSMLHVLKIVQCLIACQVAWLTDSHSQPLALLNLHTIHDTVSDHPLFSLLVLLYYLIECCTSIYGKNLMWEIPQMQLYICMGASRSYTK